MQVAAALLAAVLLLPLFPLTGRAAGESTTVRVGLFYGSSALTSANLLNSQGSGYRLGYFDSALNFISLASTTETALTMQPATSACVELAGSYATFAEASAAAAAAGGFPAWVDGSYRVRALASSGVAGTAVTPGSSAVTVTQTDTGKVLFQLDGSGVSLAVRPGTDDSVKTTTWFKKYKYYGSFQYLRSGSSLSVINVVDLEDYLKGVVSNEMSDSWPLEALKAQAVCARTYAKIQMNSGKHASQGFDVCNTNHCQVYGGLNTAGSNTDRAVEETAGQCVWYNGALAETTYFSSDGGATESAVNVWGGSVPYLTGVIDPYEASVASQISNYNWTVTFTSDELTQLLQSNGYQCAQVVDFKVTQTTPTGNVLSVAVIDANGKSWPFAREKARTFFGLRSLRYTISASGGGGESTGGSYALAGGGTLSGVSGAYVIDGTGTTSTLGGTPYVITGSGTQQLPAPSGSGSGGTTGSTTFTLSGSGWGHNVGMSQWGAYAMAKQGFTYLDILKFYYTGVEIK